MATKYMLLPIKIFEEGQCKQDGQTITIGGKQQCWLDIRKRSTKATTDLLTYCAQQVVQCVNSTKRPSPPKHRLLPMGQDFLALASVANLVVEL